MSDKTIAEVFSAELARHEPDLTAPEIAAHTAAALALGAYKLRDGKIMPGAPEAIAQAKFLPRAFVRAQAQAAADAQPTPALKTLAYVRALGARDFESALGLSTGRVDPALMAQVQAEMDK